MKKSKFDGSIEVKYNKEEGVLETIPFYVIDYLYKEMKKEYFRQVGFPLFLLACLPLLFFFIVLLDIYK